tara:strand:+ start:1451 stop:1720 length:270 start_codon:yes stop_codon:yes gene_type:complete
MGLYKLEASNWEAFLGLEEGPKKTRILTEVAQAPDCSSFLFISDEVYTAEEDHVELLDSVPEGYDMTYCQEWGLEFNQEVLDRIIADIG